MYPIISNACQNMIIKGFKGFYTSVVDELLCDLPMSYYEYCQRTNHAISLLDFVQLHRIFYQRIDMIL